MIDAGFVTVRSMPFNADKSPEPKNPSQDEAAHASAAMKTVSELAVAVRHGLSPVAIVEDCLRQIDRLNPTINAMTFVDRAGALAAARRAEAEVASGQHRGPLHGLPIALKDVIDVEGWKTTAGSHLFGDDVAAADAACVSRLREAGAIILGKTNMHELTVGDHANPWFGKVVNPIEQSHGTGGTSSGSAAAVAAGFCIAAIGTDTGGSNRSVAAATGLVGYKPTNGLIDATGVRPTAPILDTVGPIARTVEDAQFLTEALLGRTLGPEDDNVNAPEIEGAVVALCPDLYRAAVDPAVTQGIEFWLDHVRSLGGTTVERRFEDADTFVSAGITIIQFEFAQEYGAIINRSPDLVGPAVHSFLEDSLKVTLDAFTGALAIRSQFKRRIPALLSGVDVLAIPTSPGLAPRLSDERTFVGEETVPYGLAGGRFRRWANMFQMPALALPIPMEGNLSASIQLAALPGRDGSLFRIAKSLTLPKSPVGAGIKGRMRGAIQPQ